MKSNATLILLIAAIFFHTNASAFSQGITLNVKDATLDKVFDMIQGQTKFTFVYSGKQIKGANKVSLSVENEKLEKVLALVFDGQPLRYEIDRQFIIVQLKAPIMTDGRQKGEGIVLPEEIIGKVTNEKGEPIEGATITVEGKDIVTISGKDGVFVIKIDEVVSTIRVTSIGYKTQLVAVKGNTGRIMVRLTVTAQEMKEVVVSTGYQEIPQERATGSFVHVDNEMFNRRVSQSILDRISDLVPGLLTSKADIKNNINGITIRGVSTIAAGPQPLIVIDNFIYDGELNSINPNDIESVTVLKDAAAASIWGVRAGNGVIVFTTKRGKFNQKLKVSLNSSLTVNSKSDLFYIPSIPAKDIIELEKRRFENGWYNFYDDDLPLYNSFPALPKVPEILLSIRRGELTKEEGERQIEQLTKHDVRDDILRYLLQPPIIQQYSLNISGGNTNYKYYTSIGFDKDRQEKINSDNRRLTLRVSNFWKPIKNLEVSAEINWSLSDSKYNNSPYSYTMFMRSPYSRLIGENSEAISFPIKYREKYIDTISNPILLDWRFSPINEATASNTSIKNQDTRINGSLNYNMPYGLKASLAYQWQRGFANLSEINNAESFLVRDMVNRYATVGVNGQVIYPIPKGASISHSNGVNSSWSFRGQLNFDNAFSNHRINSIFGFEVREAINENTSFPLQYGLNEDSYVFSPTIYGQWGIRPEGSTETIQPTTPILNKTVVRFGSMYGNLSYTFREKYAVSFSARVDQSNFFGVKSNDRKTPLWSTGILWNISKEKFYNISWLTDLQFRCTYGFNGNVNPGISPLPTAEYSTIGAGPYNLPYALLRTAPNPQLRWERVQNFNIGISFGGKGSFISGSLEFYKKKGIDLLGSISVDPTSGFNYFVGNNAGIKGKGIDFQLSVNNFRGKFNWLTSLICSYNVDKVTSYWVLPPTSGIDYNSNPVIIGKPLQKLYSFRFAGLNPENGDAQILINKGAVGSKEYLTAMPDDMVYSGRAVPPVFGSIRNEFSWNNINLSIGITYRFGYYFRRSTFNGELWDNNMWQHSDYLRSWKKSGDELTTTVPGFKDYYEDNRFTVYQFTDVLIEKGDHIRLQDVRVSYDFAPYVRKLIPCSTFNMYAYINNLGILWKANGSGIDPDAVSFGSIKAPKMFSIGVAATF